MVIFHFPFRRENRHDFSGQALLRHCSGRSALQADHDSANAQMTPLPSVEEMMLTTLRWECGGIFPRVKGGIAHSGRSFAVNP
jgi:hypothetical protein